MTSSLRAGRGGERGWAPPELPYRYGAVLLLLVATFTFAMVAPPGDWTGVVNALLLGAAVLAALWEARSSRRLRGAALVIFAIATGSGVAALSGGRGPFGIAELAAAALLVLVTIAIVTEFSRKVGVTVQALLAALCVYIVLGLFFANVAAAIGDLSGSPYFAGHTSADSSEYAYFSFITLATVGYGDFAPALRLGRALAVLEGLMGQLYLVTVVALLVSNLPRRQRDIDRPVEGRGRSDGGVT